MKKLLLIIGLLLSLNAQPIHDAAESGDVDDMKQILSSGGNINLKNAKFEQTPLQLAVYNENTTMVSYLLSRGAHVNVKMKNGQSALFIAAYHGDIISVKALVKKGAAINMKDNKGSTALHRAAEGGDKETVEFLLAKGAKVNATDKENTTPLHIAAYMGNEDAVWALVEDGHAKINIINSEDMTAIDEADEEDHERIIKIMKKYGTL